MTELEPLAEPPFTEARGRLRGTAILGGVEWYGRTHGREALRASILRLEPQWRAYLRPDEPLGGILGARSYPYPMVGAVVRAMAATVHAEEDPFLRAIAVAGADAALHTIARIALRFVLSPALLAAHAQETWNFFHDSGVLTAHAGPHEYVTEVRDWPSHDLIVCKMCQATCAWLFERMGKRGVVATRTACRAWGDPSCVTRVTWA